MHYQLSACVIVTTNNHEAEKPVNRYGPQGAQTRYQLAAHKALPQYFYFSLDLLRPSCYNAPCTSIQLGNLTTPRTHQPPR
jgi:hypothetical protein